MIDNELIRKIEKYNKLLLFCEKGIEECEDIPLVDVEVDERIFKIHKHLCKLQEHLMKTKPTI